MLNCVPPFPVPNGHSMSPCGGQQLSRFATIHSQFFLNPGQEYERERIFQKTDAKCWQLWVWSRLDEFYVRAKNKTTLGLATVAIWPSPSGHYLLQMPSSSAPSSWRQKRTPENVNNSGVNYTRDQEQKTWHFCRRLKSATWRALSYFCTVVLHLQGNRKQDLCLADFRPRDAADQKRLTSKSKSFWRKIAPSISNKLAVSCRIAGNARNSSTSLTSKTAHRSVGGRKWPHCKCCAGRRKDCPLST